MSILRHGRRGLDGRDITAKEYHSFAACRQFKKIKRSPWLDATNLVPSAPHG